MDQTLRRLRNTTEQNSVKDSNDNLVVSIPYDSRYSSSLRKSLSKYHIGTAFKSTNTLRSILTHTKTPTAAKHQKNVIYKIPCEDCEAFYIGQTCRPSLSGSKNTRPAIASITLLILQLATSKVHPPNMAET